MHGYIVDLYRYRVTSQMDLPILVRLEWVIIRTCLPCQNHYKCHKKAWTGTENNRFERKSYHGFSNMCNLCNQIRKLNDTISQLQSTNEKIRSGLTVVKNVNAKLEEQILSLEKSQAKSEQYS